MPRFDADYVPRSAMTVFAHPDDAEFLVSGTIARWTRAGCEVTFVVITSGNVGTHDGAFTRETLARTREAEQREAARVLGVKEVVFLGYDDCELLPTLDLRRRLVREIRKHRPEVLICGDPQAWFFEDRYINHPDHRAAGTVALEAVFPCAEMELLWPEEGPAHKVDAVYVCATHFPNTWIDITGTIDAKIESLRAYGTQLGAWDPSDRVRERAAREAERAHPAPPGGAKAGDRPRPRFAEGFRVMKLRA
ncbi:MAG TPA: PIG-L deacetylase family protein [Candidatus Deferrimicrobiaceae bacterium]|nr:PIG-L deacetylase family protein [Candidatus Deferrimicrobiaceae bacterium]